jgi:hypothetical protein
MAEIAKASQTSRPRNVFWAMRDDVFEQFERAFLRWPTPVPARQW